MTALQESLSCLSILDAEVPTFVLEQKVVMLSVQCDKHNLFLGKGQACLLPIMKDLSSLSADYS